MAKEVVRHLNDDGTYSVENIWTPLEGEDTIHVIQTGPVGGTVAMADGTAYDVTDEHIQVHSSHVDAVGFRIAKIHESSGHLTTIIHGPGWSGSPATITGDETGYEVVPGES